MVKRRNARRNRTRTIIVFLILVITLLKLKNFNKKNLTKVSEKATVQKQREVTKKIDEKPQKKQINISEFYDPNNWHTYSTQIKRELRESRVVSCKNLRKVLKLENRHADFAGLVYKVKLDNGLEAIFKTDTNGYLSEGKMEETAYDISVATKISFVPPTVYRSLTCNFEGNGKSLTKTGFLSLFVKTDEDLICLSKNQFNKLFSRTGKERMANFKIFNFVFGNWDVGPHNMLIYKYNRDKEVDYFPISIDNEGISNFQKVRYGEIPFVKFYNSGTHENEQIVFPFDSAKFSDKESKQKVYSILGYYPQSRIHNYIIWNGKYFAQFIGSYWGSPSDITDLLYTNYLPEKTKKTLQSLSRQKLLKIMNEDEKSASSGLIAIIDDMLERRDMLLDHFNAK